MHFFIDHNGLPDQASSSDHFGPVAADPSNRYDVAAHFLLAAPAKAFACQAGRIIVTQHFDPQTNAADPGRVNIVLKPKAGLDIAFPAVKYYIYRGVEKSSFFSGTHFKPENAPDNCDTIRKMWEDWNANAANAPSQLEPADFGFSEGLAGTVSVDEVFAAQHDPIRARDVAEGEWIGNFAAGKTIGFEVIVEAELLKVDLAYARKAKAQIDVSVLTSIANPTAAQRHALKCERERILAYVDPAAFFGLHVKKGVSGLGLTRPAKGNTLANTFLTKFATSSTVYIDIRSEKGYSYNFYGNYGGGGVNPPLLKVRAGAASGYSDNSYYRHQWPLMSENAWISTRPVIPLRLKLRIDGNDDPLLYLEDKDIIAGRARHFLGKSRLLDGANTDWSKPLQLKLQKAMVSGMPETVATHIRLKYFPQGTAAVPTSSRPGRIHTLDSVFGSIDLDIGTPTKFGERRHEKVGLAQGADFSYVPNTGIYFDNDVVLLHATKRHAQTTSPDKYPVLKASKVGLTPPVRSPVFPKAVVFNRWQIVEQGVQIPIVEVSGFSKGTKNVNYDGVFFLGLSRAEFARLQATTGFGPLHHRYPVFEKAPADTDDSGFPYSKYEVKVQGLSPTGQRIVVAPNPQVIVYGGGNMVCSTDFATRVQLPVRPPDPGANTFKPWEYVHSDAYYFGDPDVTAISSSGRITVSDIGNSYKVKNPRVRLRARYMFPVDNKADTTPSSRKPDYPLIVIVHGNGHHYNEYRWLMRHLAASGFIVVSINVQFAYLDDIDLFHAGGGIFIGGTGGFAVRYDSGPRTVETRSSGNGATWVTQTWTHGTDFETDPAPPASPNKIRFLRSRVPEIHGMASRGRANVLFKHLEVIKRKFGNRVQNNIGLIGHSRGGEAVVRAAEFIATSSAPADLNNINAIASLAPTDLWEQEDLTQDVPYYVLYGSRDGDVDGGTSRRRYHLPRAGADDPTGSGGFSLYDRAVNNTTKSMSFVYRANHNGFITSRSRDPVPGTISNTRQRAVVRAYMTGFMRQHLLSEDIWQPYFVGSFLPMSVNFEQIYQQYHDMRPGNFHVVDNFQDNPHNWNVSSSGGAVTYSGNAANLREGYLAPRNDPPHTTIDVDSPHETYGLKISRWQPNETLRFEIRATGMDVTPWTHLSFRICQVARQKISSIDTMKIAIEDADNPAGRHQQPLPRKVPRPDPRPVHRLTKSALMTVRLPLSDFANNGVALVRAKYVEFIFPNSGSGFVEIDSVEFTK